MIIAEFLRLASSLLENQTALSKKQLCKYRHTLILSLIKIIMTNVLSITFILFTPAVLADEAHSLSLKPSNDKTPVMTLSSLDYQATITMADIESLPMFETDDMTHFDGPKGRFAGVWLEDFLRKYQMEEEPRLRIKALDGYETFITKENRQTKRYLLATRLNGKPIAPENLGPIMLIIPSDIGLPSHLAESKNLWVWAINDITAQ